MDEDRAKDVLFGSMMNTHTCPSVIQRQGDNEERRDKRGLGR